MVCEYGQERDDPKAIASHDAPRERGCWWLAVNTNVDAVAPWCHAQPGRFEVKTTMKQTGWRLIVKKVVDRTVAAGLLVATAPVLGVAAAAVRASMGGPVFFRQTRVGLHEKTFEVIKLRTMNDARGLDGELLPDEQRLTRLGQFLRATSIDELPQLLNVLRGDMSLVGPRPFLTKYLERYTPEERRRHDVLPGMTGWAVVQGRNAVDWDERLARDVWYVDHWSLLLDAKILALTARTVLVRATQTEHATMPNLPPLPVRQAAWDAAKRAPRVPS
jgi:lipopolysaccharide/colanic/teichoic acid biosynthesis glycosyltransferase